MCLVGRRFPLLPLGATGWPRLQWPSVAPRSDEAVSLSRRVPATELPGSCGPASVGAAMESCPLPFGCRAKRWRPQLGRDDPLNLSISISGGRETNQDSLSNGERSGKSSGCQSPAERSANCGLETPTVLACFPGPKLTWNGASERVTVP